MNCRIYVQWLMVPLTGLVLIAYYSNVADDYDIWWHLQYGRHFVENRTWTIDHSQFSWTPANADWAYVTWLGSSILYGVYSFAGFAGLNILQWLLFGAIVALFVVFLRYGAGVFTGLHLAALLLVGVAVNPIAVYIKPELFTLLFFTAAVWIYFVSKITGRNFSVIYPVMFLIWVNTHGGFIVGLAFISMALLFETLAYVLRLGGRLSRGVLAGFAVGVGLSYVAVTINPYGWRYLTQIAESVLQGGSHVRSIAAYFPLWYYLAPAGFPFRKLNSAWAVALMGALLAWLFGYLLYRKRPVDWPLALLNAAFFTFGFGMFRASIYFCVLWLFTWPYLIMAHRIPIGRRLGLSAGGIAALIMGMLAYEIARFNTYDSWFGASMRDFVPAEESEFILANRLPGPLFNDYLTGGYLIWSLWPHYQVFLDPRYGPYARTGVWKDYLSIARSNKAEILAALAKKYAFNTAIVHVANNTTMTDLFLGAPEWKLVYFDKVAAVFVRSSPLEPARHYTADMRPSRFDNVTNPQILFTVFYLYCNYRPPDADYICRLYERNVSRLYAGRSYHMDRMRHVLASIPR